MPPLQIFLRNSASSCWHVDVYTFIFWTTWAVLCLLAWIGGLMAWTCPLIAVLSAELSWIHNRFVKASDIPFEFTSAPWLRLALAPGLPPVWSICVLVQHAVTNPVWRPGARSTERWRCCPLSLLASFSILCCELTCCLHPLLSTFISLIHWFRSIHARVHQHPLRFWNGMPCVCPPTPISKDCKCEF